MILLKRLTQPPALSWAVWDKARPEAVVHATLPQEEYEAALAQGIDVVRAVVRDTLAKAGEQVLLFNAQLEEL